jgi:hypothetical protein
MVFLHNLKFMILLPQPPKSWDYRYDHHIQFLLKDSSELPLPFTEVLLMLTRVTTIM